MPAKPKQHRRFHSIQVKRVYDPPDAADGARILVDRLWPRGMSREKAHIDLWLKEVAPSDALRHRFHDHPEMWSEFNTAYGAELEEEPARSAVQDLLHRLERSPVTLLYAARDTEHNNAVALKARLERRAK